MANKNPSSFDAEIAKGMVDSTYNAHDYPIIKRSFNGYVMPLNARVGIDPKAFYDETLDPTWRKKPSKK